jgi:hypothetical protein
MARFAADAKVLVAAEAERATKGDSPGFFVLW